MSIPAPRMQLPRQAPGPYAALYRLEAAIELDRQLRVLVKLRASQVNSCGFCIDVHWKEARARGESEERLYSLDAWRQSPLHTERERAALALCEAKGSRARLRTGPDDRPPAQARLTSLIGSGHAG